MVSRGIGQRSCSMGSQMMGDTVEQVSADMDTIMIRQPLGVCAGSFPPHQRPALRRPAPARQHALPHSSHAVLLERP